MTAKGLGLTAVATGGEARKFDPLGSKINLEINAPSSATQVFASSCASASSATSTSTSSNCFVSPSSPSASFWSNGLEHTAGGAS